MHKRIGAGSSLPSHVTKLQDPGQGVNEKILRLDVPVANSQRVNVCKRAKELIHIKLDVDHWHLLALPHVVTRHFGDRVRDEFKH